MPTSLFLIFLHIILYYHSSYIIFLTKHIEMKCLMPTFPTKCPTTVFYFIMLSNAFHMNHSFKKFKFPTFSSFNTTLKLTLNLFWLIQRANSESYIEQGTRFHGSSETLEKKNSHFYFYLELFRFGCLLANMSMTFFISHGSFNWFYWLLGWLEKFPRCLCKLKYHDDLWLHLWSKKQIILIYD